MLREVIDSEHQVFVFKLVVLVLATVEIGGKYNALRFLRAGGATVLVPLIVLSLSKVFCYTYYFFHKWLWKPSKQPKFNMTWLLYIYKVLHFTVLQGQVCI